MAAKNAKGTKPEVEKTGAVLMSLSGMVEVHRLQAKRRFLMPAKADIHLRFCWKAKENLDSGLRRNDERKSRLSVDEFRTPSSWNRGLFSFSFLLDLASLRLCGKHSEPPLRPRRPSKLLPNLFLTLL